MALEQFKTQVLLLHSQQSTLDALSAGFGDRYAVHVATSGTEALNTLGATPIHVIVSAQDLPGMSGLEALREAKKRSPDTVGILLAGHDPEDGLEALVGDEEVFQVVRGAVTPEALQALVDTATKKVRMLTISESANDLAANVDEPQVEELNVDEPNIDENMGEHIVMETSQHGSSIISGGTGRIPAMKPRQLHAAPNAPGRHVDVLVLTKDEDFLETIRDSSHELHTVHHANTPAQAEAIVRDHKVGVLVTDAAMVGSNIEAITVRLRKDVPRLVAVVAGRRDDGELLMDLINRGQVYRFLLKPVSPGRARLAIEASVKHHLDGAEPSFKGKPGVEPPVVKDSRKAPKTTNVSRIAPKIGAAHDAAQNAAPSKTDLPPAAGDDAAKGPGSPTMDAPDDSSDAALTDSGRFTRTMTGIAATVGKSFSGSTDPEEGKVSSENAPGGPPSIFRPKILAIGGGAIAAIAALGWWFGFQDTSSLGRTTDVRTEEGAATVSSPTVGETDIPAATTRTAPQTQEPAPAYQQFLDDARMARDAGELVAPPGSNAIEFYIAARAIAPDEPMIAEELRQAVEQAIALAEGALLEQRTSDAAQALRMVRLADAENVRLPFLEAQASQMQLRANLDLARVAVRERRFEDAATALRNAETVAGALTPEIEQLTEELATARSEQRVEDVLALASERLEQDALRSPANDNARYYYELALSTDPENLAARQGLTIVAGKLVLRAREAIDAGALDDARRLLTDAAALDPQSADLTASRQALNSAEAAVKAAALAEAERQAELEREAALAAAAAEAESAADADDTSQDGASQDPLNVMSAAGPGLSSEPGDSGTDSGAAARSGTGSSNVQPEETQPEYVAISTLKRTNYVAPQYPRSAQRRNITGWVDVSFTVNRGGSVTEVGILDSRPGGVFNDSAMEAVTQWQFEPSIESGEAVERRVAVRLLFDLQ